HPPPPAAPRDDVLAQRLRDNARRRLKRPGGGLARRLLKILEQTEHHMLGGLELLSPTQASLANDSARVLCQRRREARILNDDLVAARAGDLALEQVADWR